MERAAQREEESAGKKQNMYKIEQNIYINQPQCLSLFEFKCENR